MFKGLLVAFLLLISAHARAVTSYTDVYYDVLEQGWGVFVVQSDTFQFIAFFIYGNDHKPIWYTAQLTDDGTGTYTGALYETRGTYFLLPWDPNDHPAANPVGIASFAPSDNYHATLTYTVNQVGTVTKAIQRQTLTAEKMGGNYFGTIAGSISGCTNPNANVPSFRGVFNMGVTQTADVSATLSLTYIDAANNGIGCTILGSLAHFGRLYQLNGVTTCIGPGVNNGFQPATVDSLHLTGQGIEGKWTTGLGGGCQGVFHFAAVNSNN